MRSQFPERNSVTYSVQFETQYNSRDNIVPVLNQVPRHEDVRAEQKHSSTHFEPLH
jgi:hypothetical protein